MFSSTSTIIGYFAEVAMQQIHWQGEKERKGTLVVQSVWLTLLLYNTINKIEQSKIFSSWFFLFAYVITSPTPTPPP